MPRWRKVAALLTICPLWMLAPLARFVFQRRIVQGIATTGIKG